jgi:CO/xanthine dehydrogenase Mo-binding subunit
VTNEIRPAVGTVIPSVDSVPKARGSIRFIQDVGLPGMLYASMVYVRAPHARIKSVSLEKAMSLEGVVAAATCDDVPGENRVGLVKDDQPLFVTNVARYEADCVALIGAESDTAARLGAEAVEIAWEDLPAVLTVEEARKPDCTSIHRDGNVAVERKIVKGSIPDGEARSDFVIERTFTTPVQEHAYLEPLGALAVPGADGSVEILAPAQCPFYIREAVARCLGKPLSKVRVMQLPIGGAFGGKEDVPSEICARLAVLAVKTGRPVKLLLSREEDLRYTSKRHPMRLDYRMGCTRDGELTFAEIDIYADVGAYATLSPIVLFRSTVHAPGPYEIPHVRVATRGFYTNSAPKGAMRGFGTPQVVFACEAIIDELAKAAGLDAIEFRLKNALKEGSTTATGQVLDESVGFVETLTRARDILEADGGRFEPRPTGKDTVRSSGLAAMFYGVSLGAAGRVLDRGGARVEVLKDGSVSVFVGCTDMGQGALTVLSQITADALGIPTGSVCVHPVDTGVVPDSGPTVASRTTIVSGNAIIDACEKIKARMVEVGASVLGPKAAYDVEQGGISAGKPAARLAFGEIVAECFARRVDLTATGWYVVPDCHLDDETGQGKAYHVYSFAADIADVEVDLATGRVEVKSFLAVHDSGRIINPMTATSQVEGGIAQGIGLALYERFAVSDGRVESCDFSTYLVPTSLDICDDLRVEFVDCRSSDGPFGAKGLGEPAIIPVAAAVANAVSNATGVRVDALPIQRDSIAKCS